MNAVFKLLTWRLNSQRRHAGPEEFIPHRDAGASSTLLDSRLRGNDESRVFIHRSNSFGKDGIVRKESKSNLPVTADQKDYHEHLVDSLWRKIKTMDGLKRYLVLTGLVLALAACARQRPVLYPNAHLKYVGKQIAEADTEECIQMAIDYGAREDRGGRVAKDTAKGAAVGGAAGTAVGAVTGNVGRGAAAGAAGGGAASMTRSMLNSGKPDAVFKRFVEQCLRDKGYQPIGWR